MVEQLQGSVSIQAEPPTLGEILEPQKDHYNGLSAHEKYQVVDGYIREHLDPHPNYSSLDNNQRLQVRTGLIKKYVFNQPDDQVQNQENPNQALADYDNRFAPIDNSPQQILRDLGAATMGVSTNALKMGTLNIADFTQQAKQASQALGASPQVYNDPYSAQAIGGSAAGGVVSGAAAVKALGPKVAFPLLALGPEAVNLAKGHTTPPQALFQGGINLATFGIPGGKTVLSNALKQGAGGALAGAVSSAAGDIYNKRPVDTAAMLKNAAIQGALGAGLGAGYSKVDNLPMVKTGQEKPVSIAQVRRTAPKPEPLPEPPPGAIQGRVVEKAAPPVDRKQQALDIHKALNSPDVNERIRAKDLVAQLRKLARDQHSKVNPSRIRRRGDQSAKEIITHLEMVGEQAKPAVPADRMDRIVKAGVRYRQQGGEGAARYENYLDRNFSKQDKRMINAKIREIQGKQKTQAETEKARATTRREVGKEKAKQANLQKQADKAKALKQEREQLAKQRAQQEAEKKANKLTERQKKAPKVLSDAEIETRSDDFIGHIRKNEKGTLEAKLTYHRKASKHDYTKDGFSKERSEAIQKTHQQLLDRYAQKKQLLAEARKQQSPEAVKKANEVNRAELKTLNDQGGQFKEGEKTALQRPNRGLTWEQVKEAIRNKETRRKAQLVAKAIARDGEIVIRYDAERSGDTSTFERKRVSPLNFDFNGDRLVFNAVNENGHIGEYYLDPSPANPDTGMISYTHDVTVLENTFGKAKRGLTANIEYGQREVKVNEILRRPVRERAGYTSELQAAVADMEATIKAIKRRQKKGLVAADTIVKMAKQSKVVGDTILKHGQEELKPGDGKALSGEIGKARGKTRKKIADDTGC